MASEEQGKATIKKYMLDPDHMWSDHGIRTLSKNDPDYNNRNIIKPHSNWQGPIWPIANYMYIHGLLNYGFKEEAIEAIKKVTEIVIDDIKKTGATHECYDAETGKPLAADNFVSWNILVGNLLDEAVNNKNPFEV